MNLLSPKSYVCNWHGLHSSTGLKNKMICRRYVTSKSKKWRKSANSKVKINSRKKKKKKKTIHVQMSNAHYCEPFISTPVFKRLLPTSEWTREWVFIVHTLLPENIPVEFSRWIKAFWGFSGCWTWLWSFYAGPFGRTGSLWETHGR